MAITNPLFVDDTIKCGFWATLLGFRHLWLVVRSEHRARRFLEDAVSGSPAAGLYGAYIGASNSSGSIFQTLGAAVQANTTYTLKIEVGARADYRFTGYKAALLAGNVVLTEGNDATPVGGTFVTENLVYSSGANPAQLGQPLQVYIKSTGFGETVVDAVNLQAA